MLQLTSEKFGAPIDLDNRGTNMGANTMVSQFVSMKKSYNKRLYSITDPKDGDKDPHACRYFCESDCAYIFNAEIMQALLDAMPYQKDIDGKDLPSRDGCVILFQGLKRETKAKGNMAFGRPTIIACAYKHSEKDKALVQIKQFPTSSKVGAAKTDGFEHPGDGLVAPPPIESTMNSEDTKHVVKYNTKLMGDTEFLINDHIDLDSLADSFF